VEGGDGRCRNRGGDRILRRKNRRIGPQLRRQFRAIDRKDDRHSYQWKSIGVEIIDGLRKTVLAGAIGHSDELGNQPSPRVSPVAEGDVVEAFEGVFGLAIDVPPSVDGLASRRNRHCHRVKPVQNEQEGGAHVMDSDAQAFEPAKEIVELGFGLADYLFGFCY